MVCQTCNESDIIRVHKPECVKFICRQGHSWTEEYVDQGGVHQRPQAYEIRLEDVLFKEEKKLYKKILRQIENNQEFFLQASPKEIAAYFIEGCNYSAIEIYRLFRKIEKYGPGKLYG